jgi:hypothetical protein
MYYKLPEKQLIMTTGVDKERNSLHVGIHKKIKSRIKICNLLPAASDLKPCCILDYAIVYLLPHVIHSQGC